MANRVLAVTAGLAATGAGCVAYGALYEAKAFTLRRFDVPVLPPGTAPIRILHVSDLHIVTGQPEKLAWIRSLAALDPDLVVNTGDTLSAADAIPDVMSALEPLFAFPGCFVPGTNDYFAPRRKNPLRYFSPRRGTPRTAQLPWSTLASAMADAGWLDLTHRRAPRCVNGSTVALAGTDDPHLYKVRYHRIAGPADAAATVRIGVTHSPEPYLLREFAADGYDLVLAGHTHGGQVRIPFGPAIVTNCGIDVHRARWLHRWDDRMWFHVCAGLGTNPFLPIRFGCRPEASLLTLVPRPA
jgi:predicted MPP superfamily phosphohydrolase